MESSPRRPTSPAREAAKTEPADIEDDLTGLRAVYIPDGNVHRPEFTEILALLIARPSSNERLNVEVSGHYSKRFPTLKALLDSGAA